MEIIKGYHCVLFKISQVKELPIFINLSLIKARQNPTLAVHL